MMGGEFTEAQVQYTGPDEIRMFADLLPYIGEVVIAFSRLERAVGEATEVLLQLGRGEADEMESLVQSFAARITFFELVARPHARKNSTEAELAQLIADTRAVNSLRNQVLHNAFRGVGGVRINGKVTEVSVMKRRYRKTEEGRSYSLSTAELREAAVRCLKLSADIPVWALATSS